jgi:hypothetical protein
MLILPSVPEILVFCAPDIARQRSCVGHERLSRARGTRMNVQEKRKRTIAFNINTLVGSFEKCTLLSLVKLQMLRTIVAGLSLLPLAIGYGVDFQSRASAAVNIAISKNETVDIPRTLYGYMWEVST